MGDAPTSDLPPSTEDVRALPTVAEELTAISKFIGAWISNRATDMPGEQGEAGLPHRAPLTADHPLAAASIATPSRTILGALAARVNIAHAVMSASALMPDVAGLRENLNVALAAELERLFAALRGANGAGTHRRSPAPPLAP